MWLWLPLSILCVLGGVFVYFLYCEVARWFDQETPRSANENHTHDWAIKHDMRRTCQTTFCVLNVVTAEYEDVFWLQCKLCVWACVLVCVWERERERELHLLSICYPCESRPLYLRLNSVVFPVGSKNICYLSTFFNSWPHSSTSWGTHIQGDWIDGSGDDSLLSHRNILYTWGAPLKQRYAPSLRRNPF